jgi:hypothetical protein
LLASQEVVCRNVFPSRCDHRDNAYNQEISNECRRIKQVEIQSGEGSIRGSGMMPTDQQ